MLHTSKMHKKTQLFVQLRSVKWREKDSNLRRRSQRIYSPSPLATRESLQKEKLTSHGVNSFWQRLTFPREKPLSIISAGRLNFCVRDEYRCDPSAIVTRKFITQTICNWQKNGSPDWIRTSNHSVNSRVLYHWATEERSLTPFACLLSCFNRSSLILLLLRSLRRLKSLPSGSFSLSRQRPTLPREKPLSTIGDRGLNFCVRYGYRCDPASIITRIFSYSLSSLTAPSKLYSTIYSDHKVFQPSYLPWSSPRLISIS